jgi:PAS domain S-box-containing protein
MNGILIIESDEVLASRMREVLEGVAEDICLARDGAEASRLMEERHPRVVVANGVISNQDLGALLDKVADHCAWGPALVSVGVASQDRPQLRIHQVVLPKDDRFMARLPAAVARLYYKLEADIQLQEEQAHLVEAQRLARLGTWTHQVLTGELTWSEETSHIFGWPPQQPVGYGEFMASVHPEDQARLRQHQEAALAGRAAIDVEYRILRPSGEVRHLLERCKLVRDPQGRLLKLEGIVLDITERKQAETELQRLYEQTQRDARVKSQLIKEINHRVRNNLISILGLIQTEQQHACADQCRLVVKNALDNLGYRIQGLIEVHRMLSDTEWNPMPVSELAQCIIGTAASVVDSGKQVRVEVAASPLLISPRQASSLALVLNELATNTLKYAAKGRMLTTISVAFETDGAYIRAIYRDDGPGYPADVLNGLRCGVGMVLVNMLVKGAFRGTVELGNDHGAVAVLRLKTEDIHRT